MNDAARAKDVAASWLADYRVTTRALGLKIMNNADVESLAAAFDAYAAEQTAALRADNERLRVVLEQIERVTNGPATQTWTRERIISICRSALLASPEAVERARQR